MYFPRINTHDLHTFLYSILIEKYELKFIENRYFNFWNRNFFLSFGYRNLIPCLHLAVLTTKNDT